MADVTPINDDVLMHQLPEWRDDPQGADGLEWRMYWLLSEIVGTEACLAIQAKSEAESQYHQFREQLLDRLLAQVLRRLPEPVFGSSDVQ